MSVDKSGFTAESDDSKIVGAKLWKAKVYEYNDLKRKVLQSYI